MAFDFPAAPAIDEVYTSGGVAYTWTGEVWSFAPDASSVPHVKIPGDTMTGELILPTPNPSTPATAAHKRYVDETIAAAALYQGVWQVAANTPDLNTVTKLNGYAWVAQTVDPNIPELAPAGIPGIGGMSVAALDTIRWNEGLAIYELIKGAVGISQMTISDTPPTGGFPGQCWFDSDSGKHYVSYLDPSGDQYWVQSSGGGGGSAVGIPDDAPADGKLYGRQDLAWSEVAGAGAIPDDAPNTGEQFARQAVTPGGAVTWEIVAGGGGGITDAPSDGATYGRNNAAWTPVLSATAPVPYLTPIGDTFPATPTEGQQHFLSTDASLYVFYNNAWIEVSAP